MDKHTIRWCPTWTQAITDFGSDSDEPPFDDVTVRLSVPASLGGERVRIELSNQFGTEPVTIGRAAITVDGEVRALGFGQQSSIVLAPGESSHSDPIELVVRHDDELVVDLYLPLPTPYVSANGFIFARSTAGDFAGAGVFPLEKGEIWVPGSGTPAGDGTGWSLPNGGPFLRAVEVEADPTAVVVCLGGSSTAMGWPQFTAALLPAEAQIAVLNRGIAGNRIRFDAPAATSSWGRAGVKRFDEDVLDVGASQLVVAYNSNDWGLPGQATGMDEMPTLDDLIRAYEQLIARAAAAGIVTIVATVTPLAPEMAGDKVREGLRLGLNDWIRTSGHPVADFDAAIRSHSEPWHLDPLYAAPDMTHPNINGEKRLAHTMAPLIMSQSVRLTRTV